MVFIAVLVAKGGPGGGPRKVRARSENNLFVLELLIFPGIIYLFSGIIYLFSGSDNRIISGDPREAARCGVSGQGLFILMGVEVAFALYQKNIWMSLSSLSSSRSVVRPFTMSSSNNVSTCLDLCSRSKQRWHRRGH